MAMLGNVTKTGLRTAALAALALGLGACGSAAGRQAIAAAPSPPSADGAAARAEREGRLGEALVLRRAAAQAAPREAALRAALARTYLAMNRPGAAAATFRDAIELGGLTAETARGWADAQIALGRHDAAARMLAMWDRRAPGTATAAVFAAN